MRLALIPLLLSLGTHGLRADEGMWTFDNLPLKQMQERYGFTPDATWLKKLQLGTVKFSGGTGAFVSADGLVITNHHVGRGAVAQVSDLKHDYIQNGFVAATRADEIKVPAMTLSILVAMDNVTDAVMAAGAKAKIDAEAVKARKVEHERLRAETAKKTGQTCESVTLYQGGEYWVYRYKKFDDVRLVMSPDVLAATFGGDEDNYTFPRYCLDFCLFRIYEKGQPYHPEAFLPFTKTALKAGDMTLISGQPGSTFRQWTVAQMKRDRDLTLPFQIASIERLLTALRAFSDTGDEARRLAADPIYAQENYLKRNQARHLGLQSASAMKKAEEAEKAFRMAVLKDPKLAAKVGQSWARIEQAVKAEKVLYLEHAVVTGLAGRNQPLLGQALDLVRVHGELAKPMDKRLAEFQNEAGTKSRITSVKPIPKSLELARLTWGLEEVVSQLGAKHAVTLALLGGKSPREVAQAAISGTRVDDAAFRKQLLELGAKAVSESSDPLLVLARKVAGHHDRVRLAMETQVTHVIAEHSTRMAGARFALYGKSQYPDATNTLRLSFGKVETYATGSGTRAQPFSTLYGLYDRFEGWGGNVAPGLKGQWKLDPRWVDRRDKLDLATPHTFVYSCDTVGGNSGSPVVNRAGEFVGINHDSIFEGQGGYYIYDPATKRAIAVDSRVILESLAKIYDAPHLVSEIRGQ